LDAGAKLGQTGRCLGWVGSGGAYLCGFWLTNVFGSCFTRFIVRHMGAVAVLAPKMGAFVNSSVDDFYP